MNMAKVCRVCRLERVFMVALDNENHEESADIIKMLDCIVESSGLATLPKFICHPCLQQLKFTYNFNLKLQHLINADQKANEENCGIIQQQPDRDRTRPFMCELCGRQFKVKEHFETHCKRHSEKTKQFRCVACGMCFLLKQHLIDHKCRKWSMASDVRKSLGNCSR